MKDFLMCTVTLVFKKQFLVDDKKLDDSYFLQNTYQYPQHANHAAFILAPSVYKTIRKGI